MRIGFGTLCLGRREYLDSVIQLRPLACLMWDALVDCAEICNLTLFNKAARVDRI